ncbi:MAG: tRNA pseudouridine(13) synthase TruD, partial [Promethearchaeota archaeon]
MDDFAYENFVGIRHHVTMDCKGIGGEIKRLISDFIVQEITKERNILSSVSPKVDNTFIRKPNRSNRKYTKFVLHKFGMDTIHAIEILAKRLGIPSSKFKFAGLKDNHAITAQLVTVEGDYWQELFNIRGTLPHFEIASIDYASKPLKTGDLWGNHFLIKIRDIGLDPDACRERMTEITEMLEGHGGFLNYFGLQRFGSHRPNSQNIGKKLILKDWKGAIEEILIPSFSRETPEAVMARKIYEETNDPALTLKNLPESLYYEKIVLEHLSTHSGDFKGALLSLPAQIIS